MNEKYWGEKKPPKEKSAQNPPADKHIAVHENKIYYYAGVGRDSAAELNKKIGELESKSLTLGNNLDIDPPILRLMINYNELKHYYLVIKNQQLKMNQWKMHI